ncbi:MAG: ribonuclease HI family protein [bacterium]
MSHNQLGKRGKVYLVQIDGSSRCNPGPAGIGVRIISPDGKVVKEISRSIGKRTNNQAEYQALIQALDEIRILNNGQFVIQTDSELLYYQLNGRYRVRNEELKELYIRAKRLLSSLPNVTLKLISRQSNRAADRLAKAAAGAGSSVIDEKRTRL